MFNLDGIGGLFLLSFPFALLAACQGYFPGKGQGQRFQVFPSAHLGVQLFAGENDAYGNEKSQSKGNQEEFLFIRSGRNHAACGRHDDARIISGEGLRQLVFLTFLQQEEVERLFHFLLTFHREQVFALRGVGGDACRGLLFALLQSTQLGVQRRDVVVDGGDDGAPHVLQRLVEVYHQRIRFAAVCHEVVALQLHGVVVRYLSLDA